MSEIEVSRYLARVAYVQAADRELRARLQELEGYEEIDDLPSWVPRPDGGISEASGVLIGGGTG